MKGAVKRNAALSVKETERKQLIAELVPAVSMVIHTAHAFKVTACLLQCRVIHDIEGWHIIAGATASLHYAEELLGNTQKQAAPVIGRIGQETIETVLTYLGTQQPKPLGLVEAEYADLKQADEKKVKKQHRTGNALFLRDMCLTHQLAKAKLMAYGNNFLPKAIFFTQNVA
jgi:hypothetical protein